MNKDDFKVLGKEFKAMIKDIFGSGKPEIGRNVGEHREQRAGHGF